jgi:hypothetical protein
MNSLRFQIASPEGIKKICTMFPDVRSRLPTARPSVFESVFPPCRLGLFSFISDDGHHRQGRQGSQREELYRAWTRRLRRPILLSYSSEWMFARRRCHVSYLFRHISRAMFPRHRMLHSSLFFLAEAADDLGYHTIYILNSGVPFALARRLPPANLDEPYTPRPSLLPVRTLLISSRFPIHLIRQLDLER